MVQTYDPRVKKKKHKKNRASEELLRVAYFYCHRIKRFKIIIKPTLKTVSIN